MWVLRYFEDNDSLWNGYGARDFQYRELKVANDLDGWLSWNQVVNDTQVQKEHQGLLSRLSQFSPGLQGFNTFKCGHLKLLKSESVMVIQISM